MHSHKERVDCHWLNAFRGRLMVLQELTNIIGKLHQ